MALGWIFETVCISARRGVILFVDIRITYIDLMAFLPHHTISSLPSDLKYV
jgi:hypothetical protein